MSSLDKESFFNELDGRGFEFLDKTETEYGFKDDALNMAHEMWQAGLCQQQQEIESLKAQLAQYQSGDYVLVNKKMIRTLVNELDYVFSEHELLGLTDLIALRDGFCLSLDQKTTPKQIDDYVLVPRKPTIEMLKNGDEALQEVMVRNTYSQDRLESKPLAVWVAMLKVGASK